MTISFALLRDSRTTFLSGLASELRVCQLYQTRWIRISERLFELLMPINLDFL